MRYDSAICPANAVDIALAPPEKRSLSCGMVEMAPEPYQVSERRPIAARNLALSHTIAKWLARKGVSPNAISVAGMVSGLIAGLAFAATSFLPPLAQRVLWAAGALFVQLRLQANLFDGMVAIESKRASAVGELYNEVPDRFSDAGTLIGAGYAVGGFPVLGYAAACVAIFTAYIRAMGKAAGTPQEFCGPMAKQHRMFVITMIALYLALSPAQWQPRWGSEAGVGLISVGLVVIVVGSLITAWRRLARIAANLRKRAA
jgi:phosphatidylglycerophosphate synthase